MIFLFDSSRRGGPRRRLNGGRRWDVEECRAVEARWKAGAATSFLTTRFVAAIVYLGLTSPVLGQTYTTMLASGPSNNRVDMVFIGDGYTAAELDTTYRQHVQSQIDYVFGPNQPPFSRYANFFNVHRVDVASNQSGADHPSSGVFVDTALDGTYGGTGSFVGIDQAKGNAAIATAFAGTGITADTKLAALNDPQFGGTAGVTSNWAVYSARTSGTRDLLLHELGHSLGRLHDEYYTSGTTFTGPEPNYPNVTKSPNTHKWDRWLGYVDPGTSIGAIGYYEGGAEKEFGIYRPSASSRMRSNSRPYDAVGREQLIVNIYKHVNPLDSWLDNTAPLFNPASLWVGTVDPDVINVQWFVDGLPLTTSGESLALNELSLAPGSHEIVARAYDSVLDHRFSGDSLDWYRLPNVSDLEQRVAWDVNIFAPEPPVVRSIEATMAGKVLDTDSNGLGDSHDNLPGPAPGLISAAVNKFGGTDEIHRMQFEWNVSDLELDDLVAAKVTLHTSKGSIDALDTFFYHQPGDEDGQLTNDDFEAAADVVPGVVMPVSPGVGAFEFDVTSLLMDDLSRGNDFFSLQGRVDETLGVAGQSRRGLQVRTTASSVNPSLRASLELTLRVTGDFNGDLLVNGGDLSIWRTAFGGSRDADADADGDSDGVDFMVWQRQFGVNFGPQASYAAPEPTCTRLLLIGLFARLAARSVGGLDCRRQLPGLR